MPDNLSKMSKINVNYEEFPALTKSQPISFDSFSSPSSRNLSRLSSEMMPAEVSQLGKKNKVKKKRDRLENVSKFMGTPSSSYEPDVLWHQNNTDGEHPVDALFHAVEDEGFAEGVDEIPPRRTKNTLSELKATTLTCSHHQEGDTEEPVQSNDDDNVLEWSSGQQLVADLSETGGNGRDTGYGSPALHVPDMTVVGGQSVPVAMGTRQRPGKGEFLSVDTEDETEGDYDGEERAELEGNDLLHLISNSLDRFNASLHPVDAGCSRSGELDGNGEEADAAGIQQVTNVSIPQSTLVNWWDSDRFNLPASYPDQEVTLFHQQPSLGEGGFCRPVWFSNPESKVRVRPDSPLASQCSADSTSSPFARKLSDPRQTRSLRLLNVFDGGPLRLPNLCPPLSSTTTNGNTQKSASSHDVQTCTGQHYDSRCSQVSRSLNQQWPDISTDCQPINAVGQWSKNTIQASGDDAQLHPMGMCASLPTRISRQGDENSTLTGSNRILEQASTVCRQAVLARLLGGLDMSGANRRLSIFCSRWEDGPALAEEQVTHAVTGDDVSSCVNSRAPSSILPPNMLFDAVDGEMRTSKSAGLITKLGLAGQGRSGRANQIEARSDLKQHGRLGLPHTVEPGSYRPVYTGSLHGMSPDAYSLVHPGDEWRSSRGENVSSGDDLQTSQEPSVQSQGGGLFHEADSFVRPTGLTGRPRRSSATSQRSAGRCLTSAGVDCGKPLVAKWRRACSFYLRGHCKKEDCEFAHDLTKVTCKFWEMSECFKGNTCPFLHGYPNEGESLE